MTLPIKSRLAFGLTAALLAAFAADAGGIKKWVDDEGQVHYGTTIPPEYADQAHSELTPQGIEIRRHERAKTPEEIQREQELAALRAEQRKLIEEQRARDRILLNLYRNEDDLVMARDGKLAQLDAQIRLSHQEIRRQKDRLSALHATAAAAERSGRQLTGTEQANLASTQRSIEKGYSFILEREDEKLATIDRYGSDLERLRQLRRTGIPAENVDVVRRSDIPDLVETAVRCTQPADCEQLWETAQAYALRHATTAVDLSAERILVTAPPRQLRDISITVSRLDEPERGGERIFMDVQCANFTEAREFCRGPEVGSIRDGFRVAMGGSGAVSADQ